MTGTDREGRGCSSTFESLNSPALPLASGRIGALTTWRSFVFGSVSNQPTASAEWFRGGSSNSWSISSSAA